jgi:hypothetical protein
VVQPVPTHRPDSSPQPQPNRPAPKNRPGRTGHQPTHQPTHRPTHRPTRHTTTPRQREQPRAIGPRIVQPIIAPLRNLGRDISNVTGWSVFAGPLGWLFTGLLLVAVAMIATAFALGRRRTSLPGPRK